MYDIFNKKIYLNFLVKNVIKKSYVKFDAFSRQNGSFIFPQNGGAQKRKSYGYESNLLDSCSVVCVAAFFSFVFGHKNELVDSSQVVH